jgi:hypothetical protein
MLGIAATARVAAHIEHMCHPGLVEQVHQVRFGQCAVPDGIDGLSAPHGLIELSRLNIAMPMRSVLAEQALRACAMSISGTQGYLGIGSPSGWPYRPDMTRHHRTVAMLDTLRGARVLPHPARLRSDRRSHRADSKTKNAPGPRRPGVPEPEVARC